MTDIVNTLGEKHCFYSNGYMFCNYITRKTGKIVYSTKGYLKFFVGYRKLRNEKEREIQKESPL